MRLSSMRHLFLSLCLCLVFGGSLLAQAFPRKDPDRYELTAQYLAGRKIDQWVLILANSHGWSTVIMPDELLKYVKVLVPTGSVLVFDSGCDRIEGQPEMPLDSKVQSDALKQLC